MRTTLIAVLFLVLIASFTLHADIFMKQKQHTDGMSMMGQTQPAKDIIQNVWITEDAISSQSEDHTILFLFKQKKMIMINHLQKTYTEMPMSFQKVLDKAMEDKKDLDQSEKEDFMKMAQGMTKFEITVTPTNETKKINKWNCKKYNQEVKMGMGPISSEVWATEELEMDYSLYAKFSTSMMAMQPGFHESYEKAMKELEKIKGVPVFTKTVVKMMGMEMKSSQELLEFKTGTAPKGTFDKPSGYKKTSMMQNYR